MSLTVDDLIRRHIADCQDGFVLGVEAEKCVAEITEKYGATFRKWLDDNAVRFVAVVMGEYVRSERAKATRRRSSRVFADVAERFAAGDESAFDDYLAVPYCVNDGDEWKPLRAMTNVDCWFVASGYEQRAASNAFKAQVLRAVAKRVPDGLTVGDVWSAEELAELFGDK